VLLDIVLIAFSFFVVDGSATNSCDTGTLFAASDCSSGEMMINSDLIIFSRSSSLLLISSATFVALN